VLAAGVAPGLPAAACQGSTAAALMAFQPFSTAPPTERDLRHTRSLEKVRHAWNTVPIVQCTLEPQAIGSVTLSLLIIAACSWQLALHAETTAQVSITGSVVFFTKLTCSLALQCLQDHGLYESQAEALLREEVLGRLHSLMLQWVSRVAEIRGTCSARLPGIAACA
jgi:hypothetical protein